LIETIAEAGGVSVWAHPPASVLHDLLPSLVDYGLAGLEVYRPMNSDAWIWELEESAKHFDLVTTGGSDWHNLQRNAPLGSWHLEATQIPQFIEIMGLSVS
jgi:predicted metal-dependent phosphoesterase TrpH